MSVTWREHGVPPALVPWVASTWSILAGPDGDANRVLPDGCVDLVWSAGRTAIAGPSSVAFAVTLAPGERAAGVRLHPGAAPALLGLPGAALRDEHPGVDAVWGRAGEELSSRVEAAGGPPEALGLLVAALARRASDAVPPDPAVRAAALLLERDPRPREVARALALSERQLRRRVTEDVGYGPKRLGRVLRLQRALAAARAGLPLAEVAAVTGYADQAHLTRECTALAGVPPARLLR